MTQWSNVNIDYTEGGIVTTVKYKYLKRKKGKGYQRVAAYSRWKARRNR